MGIAWSDEGRLVTQAYTCGYCGREVASERGWKGTDRVALGGTRMDYDVSVVICPLCKGPTFLSDREDLQIPGVAYGEPVAHLPEDVSALYAEARRCMSVGATTAAVLLGRKLLMHVAVTKGAEPGDRFQAYVTYLAEQGVVTPDMRSWVDEIRELGNDANHELVAMTRADAEDLLTFVAMLLKVAYEYPEKGRLRAKARADADADAERAQDAT